MSFFELKELPRKKVNVNTALDAFCLDTTQIKNRTQIENLIPAIEEDTELKANEKNLLLACAHHVLSYPKDESHYKSSQRFLTMIKPEEAIKEFFQKHRDCRQWKVVQTFGFLCPGLIVDYINNNTLTQKNIGEINAIFHFYHPAFKDVLNRLKVTCTGDTLFLGRLTQTVIYQFQNEDVRFAIDFLDVYPSIPSSDEGIFKNFSVLLEMVIRTHLQDLARYG